MHCVPIKLMSLPTMNVTNILEQLKENLNYATMYNNRTMSFRHKKCVNNTEYEFILPYVARNFKVNARNKL